MPSNEHNLTKYIHERRYFISNYKKNKLSVENLIGEPKCIICGNEIILDIHHVKKDEVVIFLCPSHHQLYNRLKRMGGTVHDETYSENPQYRGQFREDESIKDLIYLLKNIGKKFSPSYTRSEWRQSDSCEFCHSTNTVDTHHFGLKKYFNREYIYLCPNHHTMLHRIFNDKDGELFSSRDEILLRIQEVEDNKKPYYTEISKEQYYNGYKNYKTITIKKPSTCRYCGLWFYPSKQSKNKCIACINDEREKELIKNKELIEVIRELGNYRIEVGISELIQKTGFSEEEIIKFLDTHQSIRFSEYINMTRIERFIKKGQIFIRIQGRKWEEKKIEKEEKKIEEYGKRISQEDQIAQILNNYIGFDINISDLTRLTGLSEEKIIQVSSMKDGDELQFYRYNGSPTIVRQYYKGHELFFQIVWSDSIKHYSRNIAESLNDVKKYDEISISELSSLMGLTNGEINKYLDFNKVGNEYHFNLSPEGITIRAKLFKKKNKQIIRVFRITSNEMFIKYECNWCGKKIPPNEGIICPESGDFIHYREILLCSKCEQKWQQKFCYNLIRSEV